MVKEIEQAGGKAVGISTDITSQQSVHETFEKIKAMGQGGAEVKVAAAVLNGAGSFVKRPFLDLTFEEFNSGFQAAG